MSYEGFIALNSGIVKAKNQVKLYSVRPTIDLSNSCFENNNHLACRIVSKLK